MPIPTPRDEMRIADRIRILRHAGLLILAAVLISSALAVVLIGPIHSY